MVLKRRRIHSTHGNGAPFEADFGWLDRLKERIVDVLIQPAMAVGVALYVLALWRLERSDEAVR
jgi:hypothetical protein